MTQTATDAEAEVPFAELLLAVGDGAPSIEEKHAMLEHLRLRTRQNRRELDEVLLKGIAQLGTGLLEARSHVQELREVMRNLLEPPWHPATLLQRIERADGRGRALVMHAGTLRVVNVADEVASDALELGTEVYLGKELNVIVGVSPFGMPVCGEIASFERRTSDGRLVLKSRDEEIVVAASGSLRDADLAVGDRLRMDRASYMAFERIEAGDGRRFLLNEIPDVGRERIGGQDHNVDVLLSALTSTLIAPDVASRYGLRARQSVLMFGPPGCGKTLLARIAATEIMRITGRRCRIAVVKPAEWESEWVGVTQRNIRECFVALRRETADGDFAILVLDEVEAVGRIRGNAVGHHSDKFLAALLAELDGFTDRAGIAIVAATNRKDLVDPALLERLSDVEIAVRRPDMRGARAIFDIHLSSDLPFSPNGAAASDTRVALIESAVSRLYSPNAGNELCVLRFRDGKTRTVAARELASGRTFEQICHAAKRSAFLRHVREGDAGLRVADIEAATAEAVERMASTLSIRNAHAYLADLPQDVDVVSVEPIKRKVARPHRYLNAGAAA